MRSALDLDRPPELGIDWTSVLYAELVRERAPRWRYQLAPVWEPAATEAVVDLVLGSGPAELLATFRSGSSYLWAVGAWAEWAALTLEVEHRLGLDDLEDVVGRAVRAEDPDLLGHFVCTKAMLATAMPGAPDVDLDVLRPLAGLDRHGGATYRSRRRLAIRLVHAGRSGEAAGLLVANLGTAVAVGDTHNQAESTGELGFLLLEVVGADRARVLVRRGLAGRGSTDRCPTAGAAQHEVAAAVLGPGAPRFDRARAVAAAAGAAHVLRLVDAMEDLTSEEQVHALRSIW